MSENRLKDIERLDDRVILRFVDGEEMEIAYRSLRLFCPCAKCKPRWGDEMGRLELEEELARMPVEMPKAGQVGRYGIQFTWNGGCSSGIYSADHFRKIFDGAFDGTFD